MEHVYVQVLHAVYGSGHIGVAPWATEDVQHGFPDMSMVPGCLQAECYHDKQTCTACMNEWMLTCMLLHVVASK